MFAWYLWRTKGNLKCKIWSIKILIMIIAILIPNKIDLNFKKKIKELFK